MVPSNSDRLVDCYINIFIIHSIEFEELTDLSYFIEILILLYQNYREGMFLTIS